MPKKTTTTRGGAQRNRPKVQKNVELVRRVSNEPESENSTTSESPSASVTAVATPPENKQIADKRNETKQSETKENLVEAPVKGSAAARVVARRAATQKIQQRAAAALVTAEHYAYVRQDLRFIAILASIMVIVLIILRFVPGIGY